MEKSTEGAGVFESMGCELTCPLNLPAATLSVRPASKGAGLWEVYDDIRRRWVALTPEERVRQTFVKYLISRCRYSPNRIANEVSLKLNNTGRRADSVIYDDKLRPLAVVEYKAPSVAITAKVVEQALRYNMIFKAPFLIVSNGLKHYTFHCTSLSGKDLSVIHGEPTMDRLQGFLEDPQK